MIEAVCAVCRGRDHRLAHTVDGWRIVRCSACGHLQVSPRPPVDEVRRIYDETYFENPAFRTTDHDAYFGYMDYLRDRQHMQERLAEVMRRIERHRLPGRLLDVGCGLGFLVEVAGLRGWDAWGVELNKHAVEWANEHVSPNVRHGSTDALEHESESFDCVTMFDVIEHLDDPRADLAEVARVLRPGGLFVVVTPDAGSLMARLLGSRWLEMKRAPEHLQFFTLDTLARLLYSVGFEPFEWHTIGKITTVRTVLADLKFYSPRAFGTVERMFERRGWNDRVVDIDPHTKMCLYARKLRSAHDRGDGEPVLARAPAPNVRRRHRR